MRFFFLFILVLIFFVKSVFAISDPLSVPNNKYGIHIADLNDISDTVDLVNSSGGDWGYVTMVVQENDRDVSKWQNIFNQMRRLHLIPLVRLATSPHGSFWRKPTLVDIPEWVNFLNQLNWPIQNRYVILFNEPNHAKEWGGELNPEAYADISYQLALSLKNVSEDFFILPAGFDATAGSDGQSLDISQYLSRIYQKQPKLFDLFDGWTSHSYPNPGFSGSPYASGKGTISSFSWELNFLKSLGIKKQYPIFITETGWIHREGKIYQSNLNSSDEVGQQLMAAAQNSWNNPIIAAITPFVFNYQDIPFDHFSWKSLGDGYYYPQYYVYQALNKIKGKPLQNESYQLKFNLFPDQLVGGSTYTLKSLLINRGQGILDNKDYRPVLSVDNQIVSDTNIFWESLPTLEPNDIGELILHIITNQETGQSLFKVFLQKGSEQIYIEEKNVEIIKPPDLTIQLKLGFRNLAKATDVTALIYDDDELIHKFTNLAIKNNQLKVESLSDIIIGNKYRVVILVPYYLPRQTIFQIKQNQNHLTLDRFLPLDFNSDGTLNTKDIKSLFNLTPHFIFSLIY